VSSCRGSRPDGRCGKRAVRRPKSTQRKCHPLETSPGGYCKTSRADSPQWTEPGCKSMCEGGYGYYVYINPKVATSCEAAKCACSGGIMPLLRWDDPVRSVIWKQEVALQSDAAISAELFACLRSPTNVRITRLVMRKLCILRQQKQTCCFRWSASRNQAQGIYCWQVLMRKDAGLLLLSIEGQRDKRR